MTPSSNGGEKRDKLPILISQGEPSGIGPEIAVKAYAALNGVAAGHPLRLLGSARVFREASRICGIESGRLDIADTGDISAEPGKPRKENAPSVTGAIETGVSLCSARKAAALVTAPINKAVLTSAGFGFPGHTEFLAHLLSVKRPVMMLVSRGLEPPLRVVPLTIHLALREVFARLDPDEICAVAEIVLKALARDFGCTHPRLAIAGLNPHAGEEGTMGREDRDILAPAVSRLRAEGHAVLGPLPADTMFHDDARKSYDAALCMYHDQALIPLKTLSFWNGVNVTLGLPIVRTSPDHGTAFDIAGRGIANPSSMISAIELAAEIADRRQE